MKQFDTPRFAESAAAAWKPPRGLTSRLRKQTRHAILSASALITRSKTNPAIRCFYSHAVFPEHAEKFGNWIRFMKQSGEFVSTDELLSLARRPAKGNFYHLSFDDGLACVFDVAWPILRQEGVPLITFIPLDYVGADDVKLCTYFAERNPTMNPVRVANWDMINVAASEGMALGSHTFSHARLSTISAHERLLTYEVEASKAALEKAIGKPCHYFAWPYGTRADVDDKSIQAMKNAGYQAAFSAVRGRLKHDRFDPHNIPRHQIEFHWPMSHIKLWSRGFGEP